MNNHNQIKSGFGEQELPQHCCVSEVANGNDVILRIYLNRHGRNEYINLASQIGYKESNIVFVFHENQIRRLMNEIPFEERRLEVPRVSYVRQPREMVNVFCVSMKSMSTFQRIEKA